MNIKEEKNSLELRMYFFVPYNISPIQQGIQAGHAALRYARQYSAKYPEVWDFVDNHETWIILNGGTTDDQRDFNGIATGMLNQIADQLLENNILFTNFIEPNLNHALTSVCFLVDERVFNYEDYPQFPEWIGGQEIEVNTKAFIDRAFITPITSDEECQRIMPKYYNKWIEKVLGGKKNHFLRQLLKGKKLT